MSQLKISNLVKTYPNNVSRFLRYYFYEHNLHYRTLKKIDYDSPAVISAHQECIKLMEIKEKKRQEQLQLLQQKQSEQLANQKPKKKTAKKGKDTEQN